MDNEVDGVPFQYLFRNQTFNLFRVHEEIAFQSIVARPEWMKTGKVSAKIALLLKILS